MEPDFIPNFSPMLIGSEDLFVSRGLVWKLSSRLFFIYIHYIVP